MVKGWVKTKEKLPNLTRRQAEQKNSKQTKTTKKMKSLQKISTIFYPKPRKRKAIPEEKDGSNSSKFFHSSTKLIELQNGEVSTVKITKMKGLKISTIPHPRKRKGIAAKSLDELKQKIPQKFSEEVCILLKEFGKIGLKTGQKIGQKN